ncbi:MAG: hypothetical protein ABFD89_23760 [Bryobacteraceae bacterium]
MTLAPAEHPRSAYDRAIHTGAVINLSRYASAARIFSGHPVAVSRVLWQRIVLDYSIDADGMSLDQRIYAVLQAAEKTWNLMRESQSDHGLTQCLIDAGNRRREVMMIKVMAVYGPWLMQSKAVLLADPSQCMTDVLS